MVSSWSVVPCAAWPGAVPCRAGTRSWVVPFRAPEAVAAELGVETVTINTDYSGEEGASATRSLLARRSRPTAIVYDNDVMALAGVAVAQEMGVPVPEGVSIVAWDDSPLCRLVHPSLSAVSRDIAAYGARAAECLLDVIAGRRIEGFQDATPKLVPRGSTAPPA